MSNSPTAIYTHKVPTPPRSAMNSGLSAAKVSTLEKCFGDFPDLPENCGKSRNAKVNRLIETRDVGPFRVTLIKQALDALERALTKLKAAHPALHDILGTEGGLCYRRVRGSHAPSNHAAGTAIDFSVGGVTPDMDYSPETPDLIPNGFVILYGFLHAEKFYWAAGYAGRKDAMHFECSDELLLDWHHKGII